MTNRRFRNALDIQAGACNPSGIVTAIQAALAEIRVDLSYRGTDSLRTDPAVRLMVHQLAFLCGVPEIDSDLTTYSNLTLECETRAQGRAA